MNPEDEVVNECNLCGALMYRGSAKGWVFGATGARCPTCMPSYALTKSTYVVGGMCAMSGCSTAYSASRRPSSLIEYGWFRGRAKRFYCTAHAGLILRYAHHHGLLLPMARRRAVAHVIDQVLSLIVPCSAPLCRCWAEPRGTLCFGHLGAPAEAAGNTVRKRRSRFDRYIRMFDEEEGTS